MTPRPKSRRSPSQSTMQPDRAATSGGDARNAATSSASQSGRGRVSLLTSTSASAELPSASRLFAAEKPRLTGCSTTSTSGCSAPTQAAVPSVDPLSNSRIPTVAPGSRCDCERRQQRLQVPATVPAHHEDVDAVYPRAMAASAGTPVAHGPPAVSEPANRRRSQRRRRNPGSSAGAAVSGRNANPALVGSTRGDERKAVSGASVRSQE